MELRRLSICLALFMLAFVAQCSEARHPRVRRDTDDTNYDDVLADEASDDEAQNDGNDPDEDNMVDDADILTQSTNYSVPIGRTLRLECKVSPANGVVVQWTRNKAKYFLGTLKTTEQDLNTYGVEDRFSIAANSTDLLIRDLQPADSDVYACEILQVKRASIEHRVSVLESPKITKFTASDNGSVVEGSDLLLTCEVSGSPPPQVIWSRDVENANRRLQEKDGEFSGNHLLMRNVQREQSGKYYCYAINNVGSNQADIQVTVRGKPRVHVHRTVVNSAVNVEAVLQCFVHNEPAAHIRWYKDGVRIEDSSRQYSVSTRGQHSNLTVTPAADRDFGTFTCEAENDQGSHNRSIDLVQSPVVEGLSVDGPKLSWVVHSHQPLQQIELQLRGVDGEGEWRRLNIPIPEGNNHMYEVIYTLENEDIESGKYEATVKARNDKSWSAHTDIALVDIEVQPQSIQHASVFAGGDAHSVRPTIFALATTLIYLLVRMM